VGHQTKVSERRVKIARAIQSFVDNPIVILLKGLTLILIGLSGAWHTLVDDIVHGHIRLGHGLILLGVFNVLDSLPHLVGGLEATQRYLETQNAKAGLQDALGPRTDLE
jgi:hypothetical protein